MNGGMPSAGLSEVQIRSLLKPHAKTAVSSLRVLQDTDSTNARLLAEPASLVGFDVLFAEAQSAGRGRQGRRWHSPKGAHLYFSIGTVYRGDLARVPPLALAVGVACAEAVEAVAQQDVQLKWPNDLYLAERKLGGILIETQSLARNVVHVVIGVGLNVHMPEDADAWIDQPWSDLRASPIEVDRNALAAECVGRVITAFGKFEAEGFPAFRADYARRDLLLDRDIDIHLHDQVQRARACGVNQTGALCIESPHDGVIRQLRAGEVSVRL